MCMCAIACIKGKEILLAQPPTSPSGLWDYRCQLLHSLFEGGSKNQNKLSGLWGKQFNLLIHLPDPLCSFQQLHVWCIWPSIFFMSWWIPFLFYYCTQSNAHFLPLSTIRDSSIFLSQTESWTRSLSLQWDKWSWE